MKKAGLYIHIPFCAKRCSYCSFVSSEGAPQNLQDKYIDALCKEIEGSSAVDTLIETVYFGGGTPSYISGQSIKKVMDCVRKNFSVDENAEISLEANPGTLTEQKLEYYKDAGVNRISMGLQSANDEILKLIGRIHTRKDFENSVALLKKYKFDNISADIMLGLPNQTMSNVSETVNLVSQLGFLHVSAYGLKVEEGTKLAQQALQKAISLPEEDFSADMYELTLSLLKGYGIERYEVSNFAKPGCECRHNLNYWKRGEYLGFGAAAHSFCGGKRFNNTGNILEYIDKITNGSSPRDYEEEITAEYSEFEYIMLNLRLSSGINTEKFKKLYRVGFFEKYSSILKKLNGLLITEGHTVRASDRGFMVLNSVLEQFLP